MSTTSNNFADLRQPATPAAKFPTRPFYWSLQREFWEFRSIYLAPTFIAAAFLFGFVISMFRLPAKLRVASPEQQQKLIQQPYEFAAIAIMLATFLVALYYCLECLHAERRDRSILFWKSLPVSDLTTVLAKASIPIVVLPLLDFVLTDLMFINRGRTVLSCSMEDFESRYAEVQVRPEELPAARAMRPIYERQLLGRSILLFDGADRTQLASLGEVRTPSIADLFVAVLGGGNASTTGAAR